MVPFLTGPILSLMLIVLAGIVLRYALWYRAKAESQDSEELIGLRGETESLRQEVSKLGEQKEGLKHALANQENSHTRLRDEYGRLRREYDVLKDASRQLELESQTDHDVSYLRLREENDRLRHEYEAMQGANHQLDLQSDRQRQSFEQMEEALQDLRDHLAAESQRSDALQTELDGANATISQLRDKDDPAEELQLQLDASRENCREFQQALDQAQESIAQLEADARFTNALREQQTSLQQAIKHSTTCVQDLTRERDDLAVRLDAALRSTTQLRDEAVAREDRIGHLEQQCEAAIRQINQERLGRQAAEEAHQQAREAIVKLEEDLAAMGELHKAHQELQASIAENRQQINALIGGNDSLTSSLVAAEERISELDAYISELKVDVSRNEGLVRQLRIEKEEALTRIERERNELGTTILALQSESDELRRETEALRQEKENTVAELMKERRSRQQLDEAIRLHAETLDKLQADSMSLEDLLTRQSAIYASLNQHATQLRVFTGEAGDDINNHATGERASRESTSALYAYAGTDRNHSTEIDTAPVPDDVALGFVYDTPPAYQDDLKLISGIGEILEKRLNDLGVYTYEQIMNWDHDAIYEFSTRLAFKDRIERDEWVEQARRLHDERYGRAAA